MNQTLTFLLVSFSALTLHAATPTSEENAAASQWDTEQCLRGASEVAIQLHARKKPSDELLKQTQWGQT